MSEPTDDFPNPGPLWAAAYQAEVKRHITDEDRERIANLATLKAMSTATTTISLDLSDLRRLSSGFMRNDERDEAIYNKLKRAEARLATRLAVGRASEVS